MTSATTGGETWAPAAAPALPRPRRRLREGDVPRVRLARHVVRLADGHQVSLAVAGRGVPLVVVHGFTANGMLYAPTLSRLVSMGFKVVAIDVAGHGGTSVLPVNGGHVDAYADHLGRALDELGIRRPILVGHSMGGRLVAQLAADRPGIASAVVLVDAIVGKPWDELMRWVKLAPPVLGLFAGLMVADLAGTVLVVDDKARAARLARSLTRLVVGNVSRPWRLIGPTRSILTSPASVPILEALRRADVPVVILHGDRDLIVPFATARDAGRRSGARVVAIHGAMHAWLLSDPETFPGVIAELLKSELGEAYEHALAVNGLDPRTATVADIENALYAPGSRVLELTPPLEFTRSGARRRLPRYRWSTEQPPASEGGEVGS
ncbi:MAG TPA: alpha/beta hydrolase [Acidimicrobiales bacterium]|nr:alpha/beta hydrolase [Acidimicrobiales bacterium]